MDNNDQVKDAAGAAKVKAWRDAYALSFERRLLGIPEDWTRQGTGGRRWLCEGNHLLTRLDVDWRRGTCQQFGDESRGSVGYCKTCGAPIFTLPLHMTVQKLDALMTEDAVNSH